MSEEIDALGEAELHAEMQGYLRGKQRQRWHYITKPYVSDVAYHCDGRIEFSGDSSELDVLRGLVATNRRRKQRRSEGAKAAAKTRARRRELKIYRIASRMDFVPAKNCEVCGKRLSDETSRERGIGSECWGRVLAAIELMCENDGGVAV
jgi:hypothetical protein